jgi:hypothetical protein
MVVSVWHLLRKIFLKDRGSPAGEWGVNVIKLILKVHVTFSIGEKVIKNPPEFTASGPPFDSSTDPQEPG